MNLASKTAPVASTMPSSVAAMLARWFDGALKISRVSPLSGLQPFDALNSSIARLR